MVYIFFVTINIKTLGYLEVASRGHEFGMRVLKIDNVWTVKSFRAFDVLIR